MVMLMSYLIWLRSHEPSTQQLIFVKSFLNHFQYVKIHNFHGNQVSNKDSVRRLHVFDYFFVFLVAESSFSQRRFVQTMWTRQKAFSCHQQVTWDGNVVYIISQFMIMRPYSLDGCRLGSNIYKLLWDFTTFHEHKEYLNFQVT